MTIMARAFLRPARSVSFRTWPGGRVDFRSGLAHLNDARDIRWALLRDDVTLEPAPRYLDFLPAWVRLLGEQAPKATISLPEGYSLGPAPDYALIPPPLEAVIAAPTRVFIDGVEVSHDEPSSTMLLLPASQPPVEPGAASTGGRRGRPPKAGWPEPDALPELTLREV